MSFTSAPEALLDLSCSFSVRTLQMHAATANRTPAKTDGSTPSRQQPEQARAQRKAVGVETSSLQKEYARLSARAAQARGRGEWTLAAQIASQLVPLAQTIVRAVDTPKSHVDRLIEAA